MKQYIDLCKKVLAEGEWKEPAREGMPRTKSINSEIMKFDLREGFPILTTKKMFTRGILVELEWMLMGKTNIKYLLDRNVNIWNGDFYNYYLRRINSTYDLTYLPESIPSKEKVLEEIKNNPKEIDLGDLGHIYGYQWRNRITPDGEKIDQVANALRMIIEEPNSRRIIIEGWNPGDNDNPYLSALPVCHKSMQFFCTDKRLDMNVYCRSQDLPLGTPFNITFYATLLSIFARLTNREAGVLTWIGGDIHIYENQIPMIEEQIKREPMELPQLGYCIGATIVFNLILPNALNKNGFEDFIKEIDENVFNNISNLIFLKGYESHPSIKIPLSNGI